MNRTARLIKPLSLFLVICALARCSKRQGVINVGTTMEPKFSVKKGNWASLCPSSHPWVVNNGSHCCSTYHRVSSQDKLLDFYDPLSECSSQDSIPCPQKTGRDVCKFVLAKPIACTSNFAYYATSGGCCRYENKIDDTALHPSCDGQRWKNGDLKRPQGRDPAACCPESAFFPIAACQTGATFCGIPYNTASPSHKSTWKVTAASHYDTHDPEYAADDIEGTLFAPGSISNQAWLQIEFPTSLLVTKILHQKRNDLTVIAYRTVHMEYRVGDTPVTGSYQTISVNEVCGMSPEGFDDELEYTVICTTPLMGKYLTMQQKDGLNYWDAREIYIE